MKATPPAICVLLLIAVNQMVSAGDGGYAAGQDWPAYNGSPSNSHYSTLSQINRENVSRLKKAWEYRSGDGLSPMWYSFNPLVVDGRMYVVTAGGSFAAVDPATGRELWKFIPPKPAFNSRGASYWRDAKQPNQARIFFFGGGDYVEGASLYALDARTGHAIQDFGEDGRVSMGVPVTSPGVVYRDLLIVGSAFGERGKGQIRAYDVRTGQMRWAFQTIPSRGDPGAETWGEHGSEQASGANCWGGMAIDAQRGVVYAGTAQPKAEPKGVDFFAGDWQGRNRFSSSVIALRADTGALVWDFQETRHDIWDLDIPAPPNLVRIKYQGRVIDAVAQVTKRGNTLLLDRDTGALLYPAEERQAPRSDIPGEKAFPAQQVFSFPEPFAKTVFTEQDVTDLNPAAHAYILSRFNAARTGWFDPPSLQGNIFFGPQGGAEWGGAAFDPVTRLLYVNSNHIAWFVQLRKAGVAASDGPDGHMLSKWAAPSAKQIQEGETLYRRYCAACHGIQRNGEGGGASLEGVSSKYSQADIVKISVAGQGRMPGIAAGLNEDERQAIAAYIWTIDRGQVKPEDSETGYKPPYVTAPGSGPLLDPEGFPGSKPPWGTLNAVNLETGKIEWRVPLGEYPKLRDRGTPATGTRNFGGSVVTAGGLLFIAATADEKLRAFDKSNGKVLWEYQLPFGGYATPATYVVRGRQYIVIAAGGGQNDARPGDAYVAFALEEKPRE